jgi:hypothetical protein
MRFKEDTKHLPNPVKSEAEAEFYNAYRKQIRGGKKMKRLHRKIMLRLFAVLLSAVCCC